MVESRSKKGYFLLGFLASTHFTIHVFTQLLPVLLLPLRDELGVSLVQISLLASIPRLLNVVTDRLHPAQPRVHPLPPAEYEDGQ